MDPAPSTKAETPIRRYFFIARFRLPRRRVAAYVTSPQ
jgi:hypothetical protein